jgi:protein-S-isoprenylcysteine O-methyltransferase Ste14
MPGGDCWDSNDPFGHLAIWPSGHLFIWPFVHLAICSSGHLFIWSFRHPVISSSGHLPMKKVVRLSGLVVFMASLAVLAWWWTFTASREAAGGGLRAAGLDVLLFSVFALHHSVLARPRAKALVRRVLPDDLVRTSYVWTGSLLLIGTCMLWQPVGGTLYEATGAGAAALGAVQLLGVVVALLAVRHISVRELAGLAAPGSVDELERHGLYGFVRHPLYLGWVLMFFGAARMTGDRLLFAVISTMYLLIAMPFEEAGLQQQFGERYVEYRKAVRWRLIPYIH